MVSAGEERTYVGLSRGRLEQILVRMRAVHAVVIGDACLDMYWSADMTLSVLSRETPHFPLPVVEERAFPGAGGNVAANLAALGLAHTSLVTVFGDDWRTRELQCALLRHHVDFSKSIVSPERVTPAYCKPLRRGLSHVEYEDPRIDFENRTPLPESLEIELLERIRSAVTVADAICVADQLAQGAITPRVREVLSALVGDGKVIVVDSRNQIGLYRGVVAKPNELEALRAVFPDCVSSEAGEIRQREIALLLASKIGGPVCMTLGAGGCSWTENGRVTYVPTVPAPPPVDFVGAGDAFAAALAAALAAGASGPEAAAVANLAAAVVVRKLGTTGTASPDEIRERFEEVTHK